MRKSCVIYSACTGRYDEIRQPAAVDARFDYILFSDTNEQQHIGVWQVRPIPYHHDDPVKTARWVKTHPEILLPDYEASIWIDANIQILDASVYESMAAVLSKQTLVCGLRHPERDCIYQEIITVLENRLDSEDIALRWGHRLRRDRYPEHNGLAETGLLIRRHGDSRVGLMDSIWWDCIEQFSHRDQLSFNYALWRCRLDCSPFLNSDIRHDNRFKILSHTCTNKRYLPLQRPSKLYRYLLNRPSQRESIAAVYYTVYRFPTPHLALFVAGQWLRLKYKLSKNAKISNDTPLPS